MTDEAFFDLLVRINNVAGHKGALQQLAAEVERRNAAGEMTEDQYLLALDAIAGSVPRNKRHDDDPMLPERFDGIGVVIE